MDSFKKSSTSFNAVRSSKKKTSGTPKNFIEALKDISTSVKQQTKDAAAGMGRTAIDQITKTQKIQSGEVKPDKPFNFEDYLKSQERQTEQVQKQRYEKRLQQERMVFHRKEEEAKIKIKQIQDDLQKLAKETEGLSSEVKKAVFTTTVEAGTYHMNFFDRIKNLIELARKQIASSRTWFEAFNSRKKQKQGHYWGQVKKSGTKYMLSQERTRATQTG
jgi:hypothetical protein